MKTHTDQPTLRIKTFLATLSLGCLALGLASCAAKPGRLAVQPTQAESAAKAKCAGENTKPAIECANSPSAIFDQNGRLWAVWDQGGKVYVSHSNDFGKTFSPAAAVNPAAEPVESGGESRPKIALSKIGAVYVAWTKGSGQPGAGEIRFSRSLDGGKTFTAPVQIGGGAAEAGHSLESLAVNDRDYIYLAWVAGRNEAAALYYAYSSDGGRGFHAEKKIAGPVCGDCRLAMKIDSKKFPAILWRQAFEGRTHGHALTHFAAKDQPGPIQRVSEDTCKNGNCSGHGPALAIAPQGEYYAAWAGKGDAQGLYFSASLDHGKTFSPPIGFGRTPQAEHPDMLADGQSIHLAWTESDGKKTLLLGQSSIDGGLSWSPAKTLAETEGNADYPFVLAQQGRHYVAWQTAEWGFRLIAID